MSRREPPDEAWEKVPTPVSDPVDAIDRGHDEGSLNIDSISDARHGQVVVDDHHAGVHVRGLEQSESPLVEVERRATVVERNDTVSRTATDDDQPAVVRDRREAISGLKLRDQPSRPPGPSVRM